MQSSSDILNLNPEQEKVLLYALLKLSEVSYAEEFLRLSVPTASQTSSPSTMSVRAGDCDRDAAEVCDHERRRARSSDEEAPPQPGSVVTWMVIFKLSDTFLTQLHVASSFNTYSLPPNLLSLRF